MNIDNDTLRGECKEVTLAITESKFQKPVDHGTSDNVKDASAVNIEESNAQPGGNKMSTSNINEAFSNCHESSNSKQCVIAKRIKQTTNLH